MRAREAAKKDQLRARHRLSKFLLRRGLKGVVAKGKLHQKVVTAVGRELLGFVWAIGVQVEKEQHVVTVRGHVA